MVHNRIFDKDTEEQRHEQTGIDLSFLFPEKEQQERNRDKKRIPAVAAEQADHHAGKQQQDPLMDKQASAQDQPQQKTVEEQYGSGERNVFPNGHGKDGMVGDQGIERGEQKENKRTDPLLTQGADKESHAGGEQAHLRKCIEADGDDHVPGKSESCLVEKGKYHRVGKGMVVVVGDHTQNLLKLIDAVRRHNAGVLIEIVGKPAQQAEQERAERRVIPVEVYDSRENSRELLAAAGAMVGCILVFGEKDLLQP